ncbi:MAG TPA: hypothetical protein VFR33_15490 [Candidatus Dormibacteraeota bacterium]|nr:hypothetical protein [Candidatus Dormibacteraeota bacterium]
MATIASRRQRTGDGRHDTTAPAIERPALEHSRLTLRVGFWAAVLATLGAIGFAIGIVLNIAVVPGPTWTGDIQAYARGYSSMAMAVTVAPSLVIVPAYVALVGSLYAVAPVAKKPIVLIALAFAAVYAAIVGTNYFLQLIAVRQNLVAGNTNGMALLIMPNNHSVFWTLEFLGYFWQGVAAGFLALALAHDRLQLWIRWLFAAVFVAGAIGIVDSILGVTSFTDPLMIAGTAPWLVAFPAATLLCAVYLRRLLRLSVS